MTGGVPTDDSVTLADSGRDFRPLLDTFWTPTRT